MTNTKERDCIGLSLQDLNNFTAHKAHQAERAADKASRAAAMEEKNEPLPEKLAEMGEGDGF